MAEADRLAASEAGRPFDLAAGPLVRATLLQLDAQEYVLLLSMHHIISDGWSMGVLLRDLTAFYAAYRTGEPAALPELSIQYADFAAWQRAWLEADTGEATAPLRAHLAYWRAQLAGAPPALELPTDRPRPREQRYVGTSYPLEVPPDLTAALQGLGERAHVTQFMVLLAAFKVVLHYYTESDDIVVGADVANRNTPETEDLIGLFVNQLVLRTSLAGNPSFHTLLDRVREVTLGAFAHQDLPFDVLVKALNPERHLRHNPLFQVMFVLQNAPAPELNLSGLAASMLELPKETTAFDITLSLVPDAGGLTGFIRYNTDLFDAARIARMAAHFLAALRHVAAHPAVHLRELVGLLAESDQQRRMAERTASRQANRRTLQEVRRRAITSTNSEDMP
jgi:hypothetical protein